EMATVSEPYLIVLPETAIPLPFNSTHPIATEFRSKIQKYAKEKNILFLIGGIMISELQTGEKVKDYSVYNSAILIGKNGKIIRQYNKIHLVPFGEYTPFGKYLTPLKKIFGMGRDLTAGKDYTILELNNNINGAVNICYEDIFPQISRKMVKRGADILFIITNDAWYPRSSEPEQHFAHSIFRAIENRRRIVRCGNNNFSCLISPIGTVEESISYNNDPKTGNPVPAPEKKTRGYSVFKVEIPSTQKITIYTYYGDIFILLCFALVFFSYLEIFWKWKNLRDEIKRAFEK
ncbi:MAG TPA: apolipoprotein N-acyltransferase, partial [Victivallales bacterium]|nr:apolipoprotein N-acyltransferase [Victivallales bacterium]